MPVVKVRVTTVHGGVVVVELPNVRWRLRAAGRRILRVRNPGEQPWLRSVTSLARQDRVQSPKRLVYDKQSLTT